MLTITIPSAEYWDEANEVFIYTKAQTLQLEHSLVSISKWESKWHKAFLGKQPKTEEEIVDYVKCMTLTQNVNPNVYQRLTAANLNQIKEYIQAPMSATVLPEDKGQKHSRETATSELIYYWMIALNIPVEFQKWHLNRLLKLIQVCNLKNSPPKKRSSASMYKQRSALNAARRNRMHTRG